MIRGIFFDLDDTLFDHLHSSKEALKQIREFSPALQTLSDRELNKRYQEVLEELHPRVLKGEISGEEARRMRLRFLLESVEDPRSEKEIDKMARAYRSTYAESRKPVEGAIEILKRVRDLGLKVVIVTNNIVEEQVSKLAQLKMSHLVDNLVVSEEVGRTKPDPGIFHEAMKRSKLSADSVRMVGDSWSTDIEGALGVGIQPIWFNRVGHCCPKPELKVVELSSWLPEEDAISKLTR